jgi:hypothetical protein
MQTIGDLLTVLNKNKRTILLFILGIGNLSWILYVRFRTREIQELPLDFNPSAAILYLLLTLLYSIILLVSIYNLLYNPQKKVRSKKLETIMSSLMKLAELYSSAMETVYQQLIDRIPYSQMFLNKLRDFFLHSYAYHIWIHFIFVILCPLIPAICLTLDVLYFYQLKWFYKSLILLLSPLIVRLILYMLEDLTRPTMIKLEKAYFTVTQEMIDNKPYYRYTKLNENLPEYIFLDYIDYHHQCHLVFSHVVKFRTLSSTKLFNVCQFIQYGLFIMSWGYLAFLQISLF